MVAWNKLLHPFLLLSNYNTALSLWGFQWRVLRTSWNQSLWSLVIIVYAEHLTFSSASLFSNLSSGDRCCPYLSCPRQILLICYCFLLLLNLKMVSEFASTWYPRYSIQIDQHFHVWWKLFPPVGTAGKAEGVELEGLVLVITLITA